MKNQQELAIQLIIDSWNSHIKRATKLFDSLSDEAIQNHIAPNRNSGTYLLGHLVAVHDGMLSLMNFGDKLHPELEQLFIRNPDGAALEKPSIAQLRSYWTEVNNVLNNKINEQTTDDWFKKHSAVSEEDFAKEPHRNKINILLTRTNHAAYHLGQLALLNK
ncbi:MAG: DinB family protein [Bacteroidota bacterium]